ncbi:MAG: adenylate/guanylate cyclase domain-containing protein [Treponema sp.]|nr:adenylate/guanylate cyclase domain-containing protein [Treponema sp.]
MKKLFLRCCLVSVLVFAFCTLMNLLGLFRFLEYKSYDGRMARTAGLFKADENIAVVIIDQDSLDWAKENLGWSWPWPRSSYGDMVRFFNMGNANCVAFDMMYTEPSVYGKEDDESFASANREFGRTALAVHFLEDDPDNVHAVYPIPELRQSAGILSSVVSAKDFDTVVRRNRYGFVLDGNVFPQLGTAPLVAAGEATREELRQKIEAGETVNLRFTKSLNDYIPYSAMQILQSYRAATGVDAGNAGDVSLDAEKADNVNAGDANAGNESASLLDSSDGNSGNGNASDGNSDDGNPEESDACEEEVEEESDLLSPEDFEGMSVFVGVYAPGLFDICSTPVSQMYPGMGVHVSLLDTLLNGNQIKNANTPLTTSVLTAVMAFLGAAFILLVSVVKKRSTAFALTAMGFVLPLVLYVGICYALFAWGIWIALVAPVAAFILSFASSTAAGYFSEGRQKKYIKTAFSQYLSPIVIDELVADPAKLKLGGERKQITCYFSDVQGFTSISEGLDPAELTAFLNEYTSEMSDVIMNSGGTIDKYEGDAIIAFWNAPTDQEDHALRAVEAAIRCQERLDEMQEELVKISHKSVKQRIGLNTGYAVVGNMGSRMRFNYTMLGDSVNLAARLEGQNKAFGTYTMCSAETKNAAVEHGTKLKFRELAKLQVVGKKEAVTVFEPMSPTVFAKREVELETFAEALKEFYSANFAKAKELFQSIAQSDAAAKNYLEKCTEFIATPPDADWDGRWIATSK